MADILSSLFLCSSDLMNLGAKVLEVLACRCNDCVRKWVGTELSELDGENDFSRSWRYTGVGLSLPSIAERGRADGESGEASDMLEFSDLSNCCC